MSLVNIRTFDLKDMIANTQRSTMGTAPLASPLYLGLSIGETDVFDSGATLLTNIKATPTTQYLDTIAIGTDNTAIDKTQTGLIAEAYRGVVVVWTPVVPVSAGHSQLLSQIYIPSSATGVNVHIKEVAILGNSGATLFCRQLLDFDNMTPINLIISWLLTFN